jgi:DNA processing protein
MKKVNCSLERLLVLNSIEEIGFKRLNELKENFDSIEKIFAAAQKAPLKKYANQNLSKLLSKIKQAQNKFDLSREHAQIQQEGIKILSVFRKDYPQILREIPGPPIILYLKGEILARDKYALAIVGSRRASHYGLQVAENLAAELASRGITVVSGMARGVDSAAHRGALRAGGRTLAILGSGLLNIYPRENKKLSEEISQSGAVISEFPLKSAPLARHFPRRNRIISGLSLGVVVVEAAKTSGALITADFALEQGREVFAVPGQTSSPTSAGTHRLIKQGAKLVESADDILEELESHLPEELLKKDGTPETKVSLPQEEDKIYQLLSSEPVNIEQILEKSDLRLNKLSHILLNLQFKKLIRELPGKIFVRN